MNKIILFSILIVFLVGISSGFALELNKNRDVQDISQHKNIPADSVNGMESHGNYSDSAANANGESLDDYYYLSGHVASKGFSCLL